MTTNPIDPLKKLRDRIASESKTEGFVLERMAVIPDDEPYIELMLTLDPDAAPKDELDEMLKGMEEATRQAELERKQEETREGLQDLRSELEQRLNRPEDGIL